jgi:hypothetical protein
MQGSPSCLPANPVTVPPSTTTTVTCTWRYATTPVCSFSVSTTLQSASGNTFVLPVPTACTLNFNQAIVECVSLTANPPVFTPDTPVTFTITLRNQCATPGSVNVGLTATGGMQGNPSCLPANPVTVPPNNTTTVTCTWRYAATPVCSFTVNTTLQSANNNTFTLPLPTACALTFNQAIVECVSLTANPPNYIPNAPVTFTITLRNNCPTAGSVNVGLTSTGGTQGTPVCTPPNPVSVPGNSTAIVTCTWRYSVTPVCSFTVNTTLQAANNTTFTLPVPAACALTFDQAIIECVSLSSNPTSVTPGAAVTFTLVLRNNCAVSGCVDVTLMENPVGAMQGPLVCNPPNPVTVPPNNTTTITCTWRFAAAPPPSFEILPVITAAASCPNTFVRTELPQACRLMFTREVIPTLSEWGLIALATSMGAALILARRRRAMRLQG